MQKDDRVYFLDMLNAAHRLKRFTNGMSKDEFMASELHQSAVIHQIQIIGEAARLVSDEAKTDHPEIPWRNISNMRNNLIHRYFKIDLDYVWGVVTIHADDLIIKLTPLIPPEED